MTYLIIMKESMYVFNLGFKLTFKESQSSVTPGQAAVFYKEEILLGGRLIN